MAEFHFQVPLKDEDIKKVRIGDMVFFSGPAWTCRSRLQKYVFDEGHKLPFSTGDKNLLIHVGPVIIKEGGRWKLISFTPTSSIRFEKWGPNPSGNGGSKPLSARPPWEKHRSKRSRKGAASMPRPSGSSRISTRIRSRSRMSIGSRNWGLLKRPGSWNLNDLGPFLVDIDTEGRSYFDELDRVIETNRRKAFQRLGIPEDFEYTKLY